MLNSTTDTPTPAVPAVSSARERMGILRRMSEIGLRMAERLDRQSEIAALHAESSAVPEQGRGRTAPTGSTRWTRSFAQVSRAVSVCVALEDRIERGPPDPRSREPFGPGARSAPHVPRESRLEGSPRTRWQASVRDAIDAYAVRRGPPASKTSAAAWTTCSTAKSPPSTPSYPPPRRDHRPPVRKVGAPMSSPGCGSRRGGGTAEWRWRGRH